MADLTINAAISGAKVPPWTSNVGRNITNLILSLGSTIYAEGQFLAPITTATPLLIGQVATPGYLWLVNTDTVNKVTLRNGLSGAEFPELRPSEMMLCPLVVGCVPYILAFVAPCSVEFLLYSR